MADKPLSQGAPRGGKLIDKVSVYTTEVDFGTLQSGQSLGANVGISQVKLGDIILGTTAVYAADEFKVTGTVSAAGQVRLTATYDGTLTDGINPSNTTINLAVAHLT
jgi:hypothetical protein